MGLPVLHVPQSMTLPDTDQWENRFEIHSETSSRVYVIAQNKKGRFWACSCPGWKIARNGKRGCKHLDELGLPRNCQPYEALLNAQRAA